MSGVICGDNRFEIIEKAKRALLDSTNINTSPDEMKVLDSIIFRAWQMGWLNKYDEHNKNTMTLNEYQDKAMTTCTESSDNDTYALFQLPAEVGELMDKVAKARRKEIITFVGDIMYPYKNGIQDGVHTLEYEEFKEGMFKELGDIMWSCAQIAKRMGWTLEEVCKGNLDKLADRAKRGVIVGNGDNR
jgi:NTP pyrophosphatase (non-canonical NTP hydrolase)